MWKYNVLMSINTSKTTSHRTECAEIFWAIVLSLMNHTLETVNFQKASSTLGEVNRCSIPEYARLQPAGALVCNEGHWAHQVQKQKAM